MYYNNKKLALSIFWVVLGAVLMGFSIAEILDSSIYSGMGGAFMAVGVLQFIRNLKYRKNADYREKIDIELSDERSKFLRMKSWSWAGYIVVLFEAVASVIAFLLGQQIIQQVLLLSICLIIGVYWIAYMVLSKKY